MVKKWIEKIRKMVWLGCLILLLTTGIMGCGVDQEDMANISTMAGAMPWEDEWRRQSATTVMSQNYTDAAGNVIVYYCCMTEYYQENGGEPLETIVDGIFAETGGLDRNALSMVIDLDRASGHRICTVGSWSAILCQLGDRSYLCWTISPEYSCIIEYDADMVSEEDIFRMAESVVLH